MKSLKKKGISAFLTLILVLILLSTSAFAASRQLNVVRMVQEQSNWCWAASAHMCGFYKNGQMINQSDIVNGALGTTASPNTGANITETAYALQVATYHNYAGSFSWSAWTFSKIQTSINNGYPVIALLTNNKWADGGHYVVIAGYNTTNSTVYVIDPGVGRSSGWYSWSSFSNGTSDGTWYETRGYECTVYFSAYNS